MESHNLKDLNILDSHAFKTPNNSSRNGGKYMIGPSEPKKPIQISQFDFSLYPHKFRESLRDSEIKRKVPKDDLIKQKEGVCAMSSRNNIIMILDDLLKMGLSTRAQTDWELLFLCMPLKSQIYPNISQKVLLSLFILHCLLQVLAMGRG